MACVLVPAAEAVVVTALYAAAKKREKKIEFKGDVKTDTVKEKSSRVSFSRKLSWLVGLLWGGVLLLVFEHIWHGEIQPFPPCLTAMMSPDDTREMLYEMATVGVSMAALVTAVWGAACLFVDAKLKKSEKDTACSKA